jgi:hypothetical protein
METWNPQAGVHLLCSGGARAHESLNGADRRRADQDGEVIGVDVNHPGVAGLGGEPFGISPRNHQAAAWRHRPRTGARRQTSRRPRPKLTAP